MRVIYPMAKCERCGHFDDGRTGKNPCPACGLPTVLDDASATLDVTLSPNLKCVRCNKRPDRFGVERDDDGSRIYTVECHGETERLNAAYLENEVKSTDIVVEVFNK